MMRPPPCAGPLSHVVTIPPDRDDVVGLDFGLDDEIDQARRQHAIGVAIAAVARELHPLLQLSESRAVVAAHQ
jgi:hypothetical protein